MKLTYSAALQMIILGVIGKSEKKTSLHLMNFLNHVLKNILCSWSWEKSDYPSCLGGVGGKEGECNDNALFNGQRTSS